MATRLFAHGLVGTFDTDGLQLPRSTQRREKGRTDTCFTHAAPPFTLSSLTLACHWLRSNGFGTTTTAYTTRFTAPRHSPYRGVCRHDSACCCGFIPPAGLPPVLSVARHRTTTLPARSGSLQPPHFPSRAALSPPAKYSPLLVTVCGRSLDVGRIRTPWRPRSTPATTPTPTPLPPPHLRTAHHRRWAWVNVMGQRPGWARHSVQTDAPITRTALRTLPSPPLWGWDRVVVVTAWRVTVAVAPHRVGKYIPYMTYHQWTVFVFNIW